MKEIFPRWVGLCALSVLMILMMFNADYLYHKAFALSYEDVDYGSANVSIVRIANQIWVGSVTSDNIKIYSSSLVLLATVSQTDPIAMHVYNSRVYVWNSGGTVVTEWQPNTVTFTPDVLRTSGSLVCSATYEGSQFGGDKFNCGGGATNVVKQLDLDTFVITTSSTTNTGANACNSVFVQAYDVATDTIFAVCSVSDNIVAIQNPSASGTPDYGVAKTITTVSDMAWNPVTNKLLSVGSAVAPTIYDVVLGTSITLDSTLSQYGTGSDSATSDIANRFIFSDDTNSLLRVTDSEGNQIIALSFTVLPNEQIFSYSSTLVYLANGGTSANFWVELDLTGVDTGGGGGGGDQPPTATTCYVDKNFDGVADFIFNDVGGPDGFPTVGNPDAGVPDGMCDWSGFGTTSPPPITDAGGGLICLTGIIPCTNGQPTDPNPQTNGLGYLLVIFLLAIMILLFGVAQMKLGLGIPDWLWMIGTFAVIGFATLVGWIDSTLFIIGAVIIAALGAVSFIKKFAGGF